MTSPNQPRRIVRDRYLTPEEGERLSEVRQAIERETPEINARLEEHLAGPGSFADLEELRTLVRSLKAGREAARLSHEALAARAQLDVAIIIDLEEQRNINPPLLVLFDGGGDGGGANEVGESFVAALLGGLFDG